MARHKKEKGGIEHHIASHRKSKRARKGGRKGRKR